MSAFPFFFFLTLIASTSAVASGMEYPHAEKPIHLRLYSVNITFATVASLHRNSSSSFGNIIVLDTALTKGPELDAKLVGRVQGMGVGDNLQDQGLFTTLNIVFTAGKYNGSSLAVMGGADSPVVGSAERSVVGGSGRFRMAEGYAISKLAKTSPYIAVQFDIYVVPYRW